MSKHNCPLSLMKDFFPGASSSWVIASLRYEPFVWQSLLDLDFTARGIEILGNEPKNWSPASLALLSLGLPAKPENYQKTSLSTLDKELKKLVSQHFEDLTQGKNIYECKAGQEDLPPQWFSQHALSQVGLIALALRERLQLVGSWSGFQEDLEGLPNFSVYTWFAPLSVLYGLIPDPIALVLELTKPASSPEMNALAIHAVLSNPAPAEEHRDLITRIFSTASSHVQEILLNNLILRDPLLGREIANWLAEQPVKRPLDLLENPRMDLLSQLALLTYQAEIFRTAGLYGQSMRLIDNARKLSANIETDYSSRWFSIAEQAGFDQAIEMNSPDLSSRVLKKLAGDFSDGDLESPGFSPDELVLCKLLIHSGSQEVLDTFLKFYHHNEPDIKTVWIPDDLKLELAQYLVSTGDLDTAGLVIQDIDSSEPQQMPGILPDAWLLNLYGTDSLTYLEFLEHLTELLHQLGSSSQVITNTYRILKARPNQQRSLALLSTQYKKTGLHEEALHVYELITLLEPADLSSRREYARCFEVIQDFEAAFLEWSSILEESARTDPSGNPPILDMLSVSSSAVLAGHTELAVELCQKILTIDVSNWQAHTLLGKAFTTLEKAEEGLASLQIAMQLAPDQPEPWLETAKIYTALGQSQQALNILQTAIQAVPESSELHLELGSAYLNENALTSSVVHLRKAYEQSKPDQAGFLNTGRYSIFMQASENLGDALRRLGQLNESCQVLENAVKTIPGPVASRDASLLYAYAQSLLAKGETAEAVPVLEQVIGFEPDSLQPYLEYGKTLVALGIKSAAAVDALSYVYNADPKNAEALALLADALSADNQFDQAMEAYLEVMESEISHESRWQERLNLGLGRTALALQQVETAIAALQEAANINPRNPLIYRWLAEACWTAQLPMDAWAAAKKTIELDGMNPELIAWFADHAIAVLGYKKVKRTGSLESALPVDENKTQFSANIDSNDILDFSLNTFQQAYSITKDSPDLLIRMGCLLSIAGKNVSAIETLRSAVDHEKTSIDALRQAASILLKLNDYHNSIRALEKGLSCSIEDPQVRVDLHKDLVRAYLAVNDLPGAENHLNSALQDSHQDASLYHTLVALQLSQNRLDEAQATLNSAAKIFIAEEQIAEITYFQALTSRAKGQLELAMEHAFTALQAVRKLPTSRTQNLDQFDIISLAAQLSRSILEPSKIRGVLSSLPNELDFAVQNAANLSNLLECYLSAAEVALELGDGAWAINASGIIQKILLQHSKPMQADHVRALAVQAQINLYKDDEAAAQELWIASRQALEHLANPGLLDHTPPSLHPTWDQPISQILSGSRSGLDYWDYLGVINCAISLYKFEDALKLAEFAAAYWINVPLVLVTHARILTLTAEYQNICRDVNIREYIPQIGDPSHDPVQAFEASILSTAKTLANSSQKGGRSQKEDQSPRSTNSVYLRWRCRGNEVFFEEPLSWDSPDWSLFPMDAEDTAARLAAVRRYLQKNPELPGKDQLIEKELKRAEVFKFYFPVMLQVAFILRDIDLHEALNFVNGYLTQTKPFQGRTEQAILSALHADISYRQGEAESAYQALHTALSIMPDEPGWNLLAVQILMENPGILLEENNSAIIGHLEKAIRQAPAMPQIYEILWQLLDEGEKTRAILDQEGIVLLEKAAHEYPEEPNILLTLAKGYFVGGRLADQKLVASFARQVISLHNASKTQKDEATLLLAELELQKKDAQEAYKLAGIVRASHPNHERALLLQIEALEMLGQHTQALAELANMPEAVNSSKLLALKNAQLLGECQSKEVELTALEDLALKYPDDLDILWALANCLTDTGQVDRAMHTAQSVLLNTPPDADRTYLSGLHLLLGNLLSKLGQLDQAIHNLSKSIEYKPDYVEPLLILGEVYQKQRLHMKARKAFQQAIRVAPLDPRPYLQAAVSLKEGKDYQNAEAMLRRAVELAPHDVSIRRQLAAVVAINLVNNPSPIQSHSI